MAPDGGEPDFVGAAPGQIAGIVQINIRIPAANYSSNLVGIGLNKVSSLVYLSP